MQAAHIINILERSRREQGFLSTAQALRDRYTKLFNLKDFDHATRRYSALTRKNRAPQELQQCLAILDAVLSFRGSSQSQAAVWDTTVDPPAFIGYDALSLIQNTKYCVIDEATYEAAIEQLPTAQRDEAREELRWAIKGKGEQPFILKILEFFSERDSLLLGWENIKLRDYTGRVIALRGGYVQSPRTSPDLGTFNHYFRRQLLVCYFTTRDREEVRRMHLPAYFPLYQVEQLGELLEFPKMVGNWLDYLDDIVFIAQNTQTIQGANLNWRDYRQQIDKRQRETLRMLSSVTDLFVHITSPSDVQYRDIRGRDLAYNLRQKIYDLFGADFAPRLAYHKLLEVKGLLSNLINNAVIDLLHQQGYEEFLFFPEGVIYLAPRNVQAQMNLEDLTGTVWKLIAKLLTGGKNTSISEDEDEGVLETEEENGLRMKRSKDYMKVPPILYELLNIPSLIEEGQRTALAIRRSKTAARFGAEQAEDQRLDFGRLSQKEKEIRFTGLGSEWATEHQLPIDVRVDQLAEFIIFLRHRIFAKLFPKLSGVPSLLLGLLGLQDEISSERADRQRSGTPTGWFLVASRYLQLHQGMDLDDLEKLMHMLARCSLQFLQSNDLTLPRASATATLFQEYAQRIIEIDGQIIGSSQETIRDRFAKELQRYIQSKDKNKVVCSLCASAYESQEQDSSTVLFKPQQYSNKSPLDRSRLVRGICRICALEMLLRQVQQGLPAGKAQDQQVLYLYLYPTYFFTTETAQVIKGFAGRLQNLNVPRLIFSHLEKVGFHFRNLLTYDDFLVDEEETNASFKRTG